MRKSVILLHQCCQEVYRLYQIFKVLGIYIFDMVYMKYLVYFSQEGLVEILNQSIWFNTKQKQKPTMVL